MSRKPTVDIAASDLGSILSLQPRTDAGQAWIDDNLDDAMSYGGSVLVEHRYGPDILLGAHHDGLTVSLDGRIADVARV